MGIDAAEGEDTKARYKFPYGDFKDVPNQAQNVR